MTLRRLAWALAGLGLAAVFLSMSLRSIDRAAAWQALTHVKIYCLACEVMLAVAFVQCKTWRWSILASHSGPAPLKELLGPVWVGTAVNLLVSHVGEFLRSARASRRTGIAVGALLATIGVERLFDFLTLLVFLGVLALQTRGLAPILMSAGLVVAAAVGIILAGIGVLLFKSEACIGIVGRLTQSLPGHWPQSIHRWLSHAVAGLGVVGSPDKLMGIAVLSLLQWLCIATGIWFCCRGVDLSVGLVPCLGVLILMTVGATLPTAPAYLGTTQLAFTGGLALFGIGPSLAFAASILYTLTIILPMMLIGAGCLAADRGDR